VEDNRFSTSAFCHEPFHPITLAPLLTTLDCRRWAGEGLCCFLRGRVLQTEVNPDRSIVATFQVLREASFVVNDAAQARDAALSTVSR